MQMFYKRVADATAKVFCECLVLSVSI